MAAGREGFERRAVETVKKLWRIYLLGAKGEADSETVLSYLADDLVVIGTGQHEFYQTKEAFGLGLMEDQAEAGSKEFEIIDEWYEAQPITEDVCMVYGTVWIRERESVGKAVFVEMDSRFSILCRDSDAGIQVCNVHQSMPYMDQAEGEYYPKSISLLAEEAIEKSRKLERRVELDSMTELLNRMHMEKRVTEGLDRQGGTFFMLDLDDFKLVNDTLGHLAGDGVIRSFAELMRRVFPTEAVLGRLGGDEFAAWVPGGDDRAAAEALADRVLEGCLGISAQYLIRFSCSIGLAHGARGSADFNALYRRADRALYRAKRGVKGVACWE